MKKTFSSITFLALLAMMCFVSTANAKSKKEKAQPAEAPLPSLCEAYAGCWYTGVSVNQWQIEPGAKPVYTFKAEEPHMGAEDQTADWQQIDKHFNWVVAENCMKCEVVHPAEGVYDFTMADAFVNKAKAAGKKVLGHCLIWHSQCAPWFHTDKDGKLVSKEVLKTRMKEHIYTVVNHFKGRVDAWDVCNECFEDDGTPRKSLFYQILGTDFIPLAFRYAHEADPTALLYYNDYSMDKPAKIDGIIDFFKPLISQGLPVTGIFFQGHMVLSDGKELIQRYDTSLSKVAQLGIETGFSELDLSVLPNPYGFSGANISDLFKYRPEMDPYIKGISKEKEAEAEDFWCDFFRMLLKHRGEISRVNFWCLNDLTSWRNDYPIRGRSDYATLFDRQSQPKGIIRKLIELAPVCPKAKECQKKQGSGCPSKK